MVQAVFDTKSFSRQLQNVVDYSVGFIDGIQKGKPEFLKNIGIETIQGLGQYLDTMAKMDPNALHHVYEWYKVGSPEARLFDLDYKINSSGLSISSSFRQSNTISKNSNSPFYDKARIMEQGVPVIIKPKKSKVLSFEADGQQIFTSKPITISDPGGKDVQGSYEKTFDEFFKNYFTQAFLRASGLFDYIKKPTLYKKNIAEGAKLGRSKGISTGYMWITNAKIGLE